jgi:hypothetical protein
MLTNAVTDVCPQLGFESNRSGIGPACCWDGCVLTRRKLWLWLSLQEWRPVQPSDAAGWSEHYGYCPQ